MSIKRLLHHARGWVAAFVVGAAALASPAVAQDDPPGRVGRVADLNGSVSWFDAEQGQWTEAERNRPLTGGDRISTAIDGRAELRVGSTVLRLSNSSELEVLRLDDDKLVFQLHAGSVAVRVRSREAASEIELLTLEARLLPQRAGHYRVDRIDDSTLAGAWRGELQIADTPWLVASGQRIELTRENRGQNLRQQPSRLTDDGFAAWVLAEDRRDHERTASSRYVSPEMTGAEDLDRHGRWDQHPEYGAVWYPVAVRPDWAPYRYGRWAWVRPWGWTWVDDARWGFAPFHYGRWVYWRNNWGWAPGAYVARPVFAPALVAWVGGGPHWGVSVHIGGPAVGWVPLAPREAYLPHYRHSPVYVDRVNPGPRQHWRDHPHHRPPGSGHDRHDNRPWAYGNQAVPGAVTVVPGEVLLRRQPVARAVIDVRDQPRSGPGATAPQRPPAAGPLAPIAPPPGPPVVAPRGDRDDWRDERRDERRDARRDARAELPTIRPLPQLQPAPPQPVVERKDERRDHQRDDTRDHRRDDRRDDRRGFRPEPLPARPLPQLQPTSAQPAIVPSPPPSLRPDRSERPAPPSRHDMAPPASHLPGRVHQPQVQLAAPQPAPPAPLPPRPAPQQAPAERAVPPPPQRAAPPAAVAAPAAAPAPPAPVVRAPAGPRRPPPAERDEERKGRPESPAPRQQVR